MSDLSPEALPFIPYLQNVPPQTVLTLPMHPTYPGPPNGYSYFPSPISPQTGMYPTGTTLHLPPPHHHQAFMIPSPTGPGPPPRHPHPMYNMAPPFTPQGMFTYQPSPFIPPQFGAPTFHKPFHKPPPPDTPPPPQYQKPVEYTNHISEQISGNLTAEATALMFSTLNGTPYIPKDHDLLLPENKPLEVESPPILSSTSSSRTNHNTSASRRNSARREQIARSPSSPVSLLSRQPVDCKESSCQTDFPLEISLCNLEDLPSPLQRGTPMILATPELLTLKERFSDSGGISSRTIQTDSCYSLFTEDAFPSLGSATPAIPLNGPSSFSYSAALKRSGPPALLEDALSKTEGALHKQVDVEPQSGSTTGKKTRRGRRGSKKKKTKVYTVDVEAAIAAREAGYNPVNNDQQIDFNLEDEEFPDLGFGEQPSNHQDKYHFVPSRGVSSSGNKSMRTLLSVGLVTAPSNKSQATEKADTGTVNPLDSTAPQKRRGKEKENPKQKKPSALKAVILRERAAKKLRPPYMGHQHSMSAASEESLQPLLASPVSAVDNLPIDRQHLDAEYADDEYEEGDNDDCVKSPRHGCNSGPGTRTCSTTSGALPSPISQLSTPSDLVAGSYGSRSSYGREKQVQEDANSRLHSRRFREYCNQMVGKDINTAAGNLISELMRFQNRTAQKLQDPVKAKLKRRLVMGFREVTKHVRLKKIKLCIVSPDVEKIQSKGGLDDAVASLVSLAKEQDVPVIFALPRRQMGRVCGKAVSVSVVGVFSYAGVENLVEELMEHVREARKKYQEVKDLLVQEAEEQFQADEEVVQQIVNQHKDNREHNMLKTLLMPGRSKKLTPPSPQSPQPPFSQNNTLTSTSGYSSTAVRHHDTGHSRNPSCASSVPSEPLSDLPPGLEYEPRQWFASHSRNSSSGGALALGQLPEEVIPVNHYLQSQTSVESDLEYYGDDEDEDECVEKQDGEEEDPLSVSWNQSNSSNCIQALSSSQIASSTASSKVTLQDSRCSSQSGMETVILHEDKENPLVPVATALTVTRQQASSSIQRSNQRVEAWLVTTNSRPTAGSDSERDKFQL